MHIPDEQQFHFWIYMPEKTAHIGALKTVRKCWQHRDWKQKEVETA